MSFMGRNPPGAAGGARLKQQVKVPPGGIVRGANVFENRKAWHEFEIGESGSANAAQ